MAHTTPVTEICIIDLNAPYPLKTPSHPSGAIWASSIATLKKCPGIHELYTGTLHQEPMKARMFINHHIAFYETPAFPKFREDLVSLCKVDPFPIHVVFDPPKPQALEAPATEVVMAYFPLTITQEQRKQWEAEWKGLMEGVRKEAEGMASERWGWVNEEMEWEGEKVGGFMGVVGWKSVEEGKRFWQGRVKDVEGLKGERGWERYFVEF